MNPAGKVAVVTGGNSGLGEGAAAGLVANGATVFCLDMGGEPPAGATYISCDITNQSAITGAVEQMMQRHGQVDILINNAGIGGLGPIATADGPGDVAHFRQVIETNLIGAAAIAAEVSHRMIGNDPDPETGERGIIINTCSIASFEGQEGMGPYTAAKSALAALVLVWARDLSRYGIRVNGIAPGFMATPMVAMLPPDFVEELLGGNEFPKRAGTGEDFARVVDFLIRNPLVNAEVIRLDGGARPPARTKFGGGE